MDFEMSIEVTRSNVERGKGVLRANKALISFQQATLTRKSDFPEGVSTILQMLVSLFYLYIALVADKKLV